VEDIFRERCDARAILYAASVFDLHTAVDVLQTDAKRPGLIDQIGQNRVQEIMAAAFHAVRGIQQQPFLVKQFSKLWKRIRPSQNRSFQSRQYGPRNS